MAVRRDGEAAHWLDAAGEAGALGGLGDAELLARFRAGPGPAGALAFEVLVHRHGPAVLARCRRVVRDDHDAEDAFQATFLVLARRAGTVRDPDRLAPWLDRVARRIALRARRDAADRRAREGATGGAGPATSAPAGPAGLIADEAAGLVRDAVDRLPEPDRRLLRLTYWQGKTYVEAAALLRWPVGTVRSRLARARDRLRGKLARVGPGPGLVPAGPPAALVARTVRAATAGWGGNAMAAGGAVPAAVVALAEGELTMKLLAGKSIAALLVLGGTMTAGTVALALARRGADAPPAAAVAPPAPAGEPAAPPVDWARKLADLDEADWRTAFAVGQEVAALPGDEGIAILRAHWGKVGKVDARQQLLKAWQSTLPYPLRFRNHPRHLDGLDLGMRDPSPEVREWATRFVAEIALRDFAADPDAYDAWYRAHRGRPVADAIGDSARDLVAEAGALDGAAAAPRVHDLAEHARAFRDLPEARVAAMAAGILPPLERWAVEGGAAAGPGGDQLAIDALRVLAQLEPGEATLRRAVVPLLARDRPAHVRAAALATLGGPGNAWAVDPLLDVLRGSLDEGEDSFRTIVWAAADALRAIGDPRAIPTMIAVIEADDTYDTVYGVGYFGLGRLGDRPLAGVEYDETHDGAWWRRWWGENRGRYPAAVRALDIPHLPRRRPAPKPVAEAPGGGVADAPVLDLRAGGDDRKRYFLIGGGGEAPPAEGRPLLVVLPGGDGSADFNFFLRWASKQVLGGRWLVAQAVAPRWRDDADRVVWPTAGRPDPLAKFTTEEFVRAIIADAQARAPVDPRRVYLLGWSSGGPPAYAAALGKDPGIAGAFIAMSVFHPETLPPLDAARGRAFYLLQSSQDDVTPIRHAEAAEQALRAAGARVTLARYNGGHGWRGNIFQMMTAAFAWLDQQAATVP